jgi:lauroyl/myristoyl acyltransferase
LAKSLDFIKYNEYMNSHIKKYINASESIILAQIGQVKADTNGKIFISYHFGAFEFLPLILSLYLETTVYVVVDTFTVSRQVRLNYYKKSIQAHYPNADIQFILVQDALSIRKLIKILRNNGIVFIYFDENKSIKENDDNFVEVPFIEGYHYLVRASVPYLLKITHSSVYSILSMVEGDVIHLQIQLITKSQDQDFQSHFFSSSLDLLKSGIGKHPYQWTRWYNVDELDNHRSFLSGESTSNGSYLTITDHASEKKFVIDIRAMKIREIN